MKTKVSGFINGLGWLIIITLAVLVISCQRDGFMPPFTFASQAQLEAAALDNGEILSATHDVMDFTAGALAGQGVTDGNSSPFGRATGSSLECAPTITNSFNLDRTHPDSLILTGTLTIDFGTGAGCSDSSEVRTGKVTDHYVFIKVISSRAFHLTETLGFEDFKKGMVIVDGTFIRTTSSELVSTLQIQDARLTYPDGTFATFTGQLTSTILLGTEAVYNGCIAKEITGSITGITRAGSEFSTSIDDALVFKYGCNRKIPVSGTIDLTVGMIESRIDFGDGTCDKIYTITSGGVTTSYSFGHKRGEDDDTGD